MRKTRTTSNPMPLKGTYPDIQALYVVLKETIVNNLKTYSMITYSNYLGNANVSCNTLKRKHPENHFLVCINTKSVMYRNNKDYISKSSNVLVNQVPTPAPLIPKIAELAPLYNEPITSEDLLSLNFENTFGDVYIHKSGSVLVYLNTQILVLQGFQPRVLQKNIKQHAYNLTKLFNDFNTIT